MELARVFATSGLDFDATLVFADPDLDAIQLLQEVPLPGGPAVFAVGDALEADLLLAGDDLLDRGVDLLDSTPRQILLQRQRGLPTPADAHFPLVHAEDGRKLGKQTHAPRIDTGTPSKTLFKALEFLRQAPPVGLISAPLGDVWQWAITHWRPQALAPQA